MQGYASATTVSLHPASYHSGRQVDGGIAVNGRVYRLPARPLAVICFDGCDPAYLDAARGRGVIPTIERLETTGFAAGALAAMPTFTNPNNVSIVCGAPPFVHGVSGNFYLDRATGRTAMMTDAASMTAPTVLGALSQAGIATAVVTAKDKLRMILSAGLRGVSLSAERADGATERDNGIAGAPSLVGRGAPDPYSADLSLYVLDAGIRLIENRVASLVYLSLSDYVQHKHAPGEPEADAFLAAVDARLGQLLAIGADLAIVADHGMSEMAKRDGSPNVVFLGDHLDARFGPTAARVICPITDPFVRHHGALAGLVRIYVDTQRAELDTVAAFVADIDGVESVLTRGEASSALETPWEQEADLVVLARKGVALGARQTEHDLSALAGKRLRTHGGRHEQRVPFLLSRPLTREYRERAAATLRNFDVLDFALNGVEA